MNITKGYYYIFYKFYILFEHFEQTRWRTRSKAVMCIGLLELWLFFSLINYWNYFSKWECPLQILLLLCLILFIILGIIHWFIFSKDDKWKNFVAEFEEWPRKKNVAGTFIVVGIIIFIIINFLISFKLNKISFW